MRLSRRPLRANNVALLLVVGGFVAIGAMYIVRTMAATSVVSYEAEAGSLNGRAAAVDDSAASGGKAIAFGVNRTVNIKTYGALCDGVYDNRAAISTALSELGKVGGGTLEIPEGDCRVLQTAKTVYSGVGANITIRGAGAASRLLLACENPSGYNELFRINGDNVRIENVSLVRATACGGIMVSIHPSKNFSLHRVTIDGQSPALPGVMHGLALASVANGVYQNIRFSQSSIHNLVYGFFQANQAQTVTDGFAVDACSFRGNRADDLEFNAPNGTMKNVAVTNSTFAANRASGAGAGFGIGFANVQMGLIAKNTFDGYAREPVHIEDRSRDIAIEDNTFANAFTEQASYASHVFVVNGSQFITIQRNRFDTTGNVYPVKVIFVGSGGSSFPFPSDITIRDNTFLLRPLASKVYASGVARVVESGSIVTNLP